MLMQAASSMCYDQHAKYINEDIHVLRFLEACSIQRSVDWLDQTESMSPLHGEDLWLLC